MILELKDKMAKIGGTSTGPVSIGLTNINEALEALQALGFARNAAEKALIRISKELGDSATTESLIKNSLKLL